jgi:hypothetical protein
LLFSSPPRLSLVALVLKPLLIHRSTGFRALAANFCTSGHLLVRCDFFAFAGASITGRRTRFASRRSEFA